MVASLGGDGEGVMIRLIITLYKVCSPIFLQLYNVNVFRKNIFVLIK